MEQSATPLRCAVVGIVGRTNSGKSTLLNRILGEKVSIVSPVEQTTRNLVRGILTDSRGQLVFLDTPGLHKAESALGSIMNRMARQAAAGTDIMMVVFDAAEPPQIEDDGWMRRVLFAEGQPIVFVLNKSDARGFDPAPYKKLWEDIQVEKEHRREVTWFTASAHAGDNVDKLADHLFKFALPTEQLLFDEETITDYPRKLAIADIIREKFFHKLFQEIPHELGVRVENITEQGNRWEIDATVFVNRPAQKGMAIGDKGRNLRYVKREAENDITEQFGCEPTINIWIKVEPNWMKNFFLLKQLGYIVQ